MWLWVALEIYWGNFDCLGLTGVPIPLKKRLWVVRYIFALCYWIHYLANLIRSEKKINTLSCPFHNHYIFGVTPLKFLQIEGPYNVYMLKSPTHGYLSNFMIAKLIFANEWCAKVTSPSWITLSLGREPTCSKISKFLNRNSS